jgi:cathepsin X
MRKGAWPDINISPQVLLSCSETDQGCHGGDTLSAFKYMHDNGISDETCSVHRGRGHENGLECSPIMKCRDCSSHKPCFIPDEYFIYTVDEYGPVIGEENMMNEIF